MNIDLEIWQASEKAASFAKVQFNLKLPLDQLEYEATNRLQLVIRRFDPIRYPNLTLKKFVYMETINQLRTYERDYYRLKGRSKTHEFYDLSNVFDDQDYSIPEMERLMDAKMCSVIKPGSKEHILVNSYLNKGRMEDVFRIIKKLEQKEKNG